MFTKDLRPRRAAGNAGARLQAGLNAAHLVLLACRTSSRTIAQVQGPLVVDVAGVAGRVEDLIRTHHKERHDEDV